MKKYVVSVILFYSSFLSIAQEKEQKYPQDIDKKHELKINVFSLIVFSSLDLSYENLLNENTSLGASIFVNFNDINSDVYFPKKFSITPFYRWFFTETRYARGFFVEGFGMLNTYEDEIYFYDSNYNGNYDIRNETNFALGVSIGGKFIVKSGFTAEVYIGIGRNLLDNNDDFLDNELITRGGISLGYRF